MRRGGLVIAVTGSSGKTTTVSLLSHILASNSQVLTQVLNNGLRDATKTLRRMKADDDYVVVEAGTAGVGQLEKVARLLKPDVAIVTLVALEHFAAFRKLEAVAHEKAALVRAVPLSGLAILNGDDPLALAMSDATTARKTTFGTKNGDYRVRDLETSSRGTLTFKLSNRNLDVRLETNSLEPTIGFRLRRPPPAP